ncbi:hypothetical protein GCM10009734_65590 [Nonomuraea bangladeshensis]
MLAGMPVPTAGAVLTAVLQTVPGVLLGYVVAQVGITFIETSLLAVMPDQVPEEQHGKVGGLLGFTAQIAGVAGSQVSGALAGSPLLLFLVPALVACAAVLLLVVTMSDRPLPRDQRKVLDLAGAGTRLDRLSAPPALPDLRRDGSAARGDQLPGRDAGRRLVPGTAGLRGQAGPVRRLARLAGPAGARPRRRHDGAREDPARAGAADV